jgi:uncharacterized protein YciI
VNSNSEMKDIRRVVFHKPGPKWDHAKSFFEQEGLDAHVGHYKKLLTDGKLAMGGPFLDDHSGGMMIPIATMTEEQVRDYAESDPAVKAGLLEFEIRPWLVAMKG